MTEDDDDWPFADADLTVDGDPVGKITDFDVSVSNALTEAFDTVADALSSAIWHSIIDDAGTELFVDDFDLAHLREAEQALRSNGYARDGLTVRDLYGDEDDVEPEGAAFFVGHAVADMIRERADRMVRLGGDDVDATGDDLPTFDGFIVEKAAGLPSHLVVFLDVDAIAQVPTEARNVPMGMGQTPTVSSPIGVKDAAGVAVVNIDLSGSN